MHFFIVVEFAYEGDFLEPKYFYTICSLPFQNGHEPPLVPIFVENWGGGEFAILPQIYPIFNIGGMNLDHDFFQVNKLSEDQKKVFTKNGILFSPNSSGDPRSDAHRSQTIGGMQM